MPITEAYITEIERKINSGSNGDVDRMELALLMAIYKKVECIEKNPAVKIGEAIKNNKGMTILAGFMFYIFMILIPQAFARLLGFDFSKIFAP